jgi:predicted kinase
MIIIVLGLPGSGKTFFATQLAKQLSFMHLNTDIVRKELNMLTYHEEDRNKVYDRLLELGEEHIENKKNLILDGTFTKKIFRKKVEEKFKKHSQKVFYIEIKADEKIIQERVSKKRDFTDADFEVYKKLKLEYESLDTTHLTLWSDTMPIDGMIENAINYIQKNEG